MYHCTPLPEDCAVVPLWTCDMLVREINIFCNVLLNCAEGSRSLAIMNMLTLLIP